MLAIGLSLLTVLERDLHPHPMPVSFYTQGNNRPVKLRTCPRPHGWWGRGRTGTQSPSSMTTGSAVQLAWS